MKRQALVGIVFTLMIWCAAAPVMAAGLIESGEVASSSSSSSETVSSSSGADVIETGDLPAVIESGAEAAPDDGTSSNLLLACALGASFTGGCVLAGIAMGAFK